MQRRRDSGRRVSATTIITAIENSGTTGITPTARAASRISNK
jgi:hypothetical protein